MQTKDKYCADFEVVDHNFSWLVARFPLRNPGLHPASPYWFYFLTGDGFVLSRLPVHSKCFRSDWYAGLHFY